MVFQLFSRKGLTYVFISFVLWTIWGSEKRWIYTSLIFLAGFCWRFLLTHLHLCRFRSSSNCTRRKYFVGRADPEGNQWKGRTVCGYGSSVVWLVVMPDYQLRWLTTIWRQVCSKYRTQRWCHFVITSEFPINDRHWQWDITVSPIAKDPGMGFVIMLVFQLSV